MAHGPRDPEQLAGVLTSSPRLQLVRVDAEGVPVSVDDRVHVPPRRGLDEVRKLIVEAAAAPPGRHHPRHPFDHPEAHPDAQSHAPPDASPDAAPDDPCAAVPAGARVRSGGHPPGAPGPYRVPRRLRRLVQVRSPRGEWPGCGVRAQVCDVDHDSAWPAGATCACNTGPLCSRHHRVEQLLMTKTRVDGGAVRWTGPTGRSWLSPTQHPVPARPSRQPVTAVGPDLSPAALAELLTDPDTDPVQYELRAVQDDPDSTDRIGDALRDDDDGWGLALDDPCRWTA